MVAIADVYEITPAARGQCLLDFVRAAQLQLQCEEVAAKLVVNSILVNTRRKSWKIMLDEKGSVSSDELEQLVDALLEAVSGVHVIEFEVEPREEKEPNNSRPSENVLDADEATYMAFVMEQTAKGRQEIQQAEDNNNGRRTSVTGEILMGRAIQEQSRAIKDIRDEERSYTLTGQVFAVEERDLRSGRRLLQIDVTDHEDSVSLKIFEEEDAPRLTEKLGISDWVKVRGSVQWDRYTQELTVLPRDIQKAAPPSQLVRSDEAPLKRVELHLHTKMSAMDGTIEVKEAIQQAARWGHEAIAITDHGVVQAFPEAHTVAEREGIKVLYGMEGYLINEPTKDAPSYHIVLIAKNNTGLRNLYKLVSLSHLEHFYRRPRLPRQLLAKYREGLLIGTACEAGELYRACLKGEHQSGLEQIAEFYDYLEIQPLANNAFLIGEQVQSVKELQDINRKIVELGKRLNKPVVATCDAHFLQPWDEVYRRILMAGQGYSDAERQAPLYFRTTEEMLEEFAYLGEETALDVVIHAPRQIADLVEDLQPVPSGLCAPQFPNASEKIVEMTYKEAAKLYGDPLPELVKERIAKELNAIVGNGFATLYLIAHKLVTKSLSDGYLVGSRGSVGSSIVATLCGVTEVNPLPPHYVCPACHDSEFILDGSAPSGVDLPEKYCSCGERYTRHGFDIPFEIFMGFHGDKVPDIDLNFSGDYQAVVHKFTEELLGSTQVFRAGTIGTLAEKTSYGFIMKYLEDKGDTLRTAEINRLVRGCSGVRRTTGQHPGGMIVVPEGHEITEFTPVQYPANDRKAGVITTHFDYNAIEDQLVKLDILGHDDPTMIRMLEDSTGVEALKIPLDDPKTLDLFSSVESLGVHEDDIGTSVGTLGIPEFGTRFVRQMLEDTRPKTFGELVRISGLSHGTNVWANNAQDLIRQGVTDLSNAIATRDDIMNYLILRGMEPGVAFQIMEGVRRGRGLRPEDEQAMKNIQIPEWYIESCRKISYLFPKAHAVAYVTMAFRIAYFKVHHPLEFYATYFSTRFDNFEIQLSRYEIPELRNAIKKIRDKGNNATAKERNVLTVAEVMLEAKVRGIEFLPVDIYLSHPTQFDRQDGKLLPPLSSVQGVGIGAARALIEGRKGPKFTSWEDIRLRCGVSKTVIEVLAELGALGDLPESAQLSLF
ncbi:MAG: PolC-type DNA polymerase III [Firmicutes bacterium]|nr:PolC-type DNA polymerase III [Bacillota bacterium]